MPLRRFWLAQAIPYALVGGVAALLYRAAAGMEFQARAGNLGPDFWPKLVLGLMILICVYEIVRIAVTRSAGTANMLQEMASELESKHENEGFVHVEEKSLPLLFAGIALTAAYVWLIQRLGFFVATAPYLFLFIALGGYRRWGVNAAVSFIGALAMMFFFMKVVYVSLPIGQEPFAQVTFALMRLMGIR